MYGTGERFRYYECGHCGCIAIATVPDDLGRYYPSSYYSLAELRNGRLRRAARVAAARRHLLGDRRLLGRLASAAGLMPEFVDWLKRSGVTSGDRILDVGSGSGRHVRNIAEAGYSDVTGVEPHTDMDRDLGAGARVLAGGLERASGSYRLIMFHHSFEHLADPRSALRRAASLLAPGGTVLLRLPLAGSYAWRTYGVHWAQFDAPRHLYLHTKKSVGILTHDVGLRISETVYDSTSFQFWGSELYRRGAALIEASGKRNGGPGGPVRRWRLNRQARALNAAEEGDQAAFYLRDER